jgi:hypothetical protein
MRRTVPILHIDDYAQARAWVQVSDLRARERTVVLADSDKPRLSRARGRDTISLDGGMSTGNLIRTSPTGPTGSELGFGAAP